MQVQQLIRPAAQVVNIVDLTAGDTYQRLEKASYGETYSMKHGVVQTVVHNGTEAAFTALELDADYGTAEPVKIKVFGSGADLAIFASTPEEFSVALAAARDRQQSKVEQAQRALASEQQRLTAMDSLDRGGLREPQVALEEAAPRFTQADLDAAVSEAMTASAETDSPESDADATDLP